MELQQETESISSVILLERVYGRVRDHTRKNGNQLLKVYLLISSIQHLCNNQHTIELLNLLAQERRAKATLLNPYDGVH